jgi:hypothetical protein
LYPDGSEGDPDPSLALLRNKAVHRKFSNKLCIPKKTERKELHS